jgi:dihydroneopterin aldolase
MAASRVARWDGHVSDRIYLEAMVLRGTHGVFPQEQASPQPFEVDVDLALNLQPAGLSDDLAQTIDYSAVYDACRQIVESTRFNLIEALAEAIAQELLANYPADEVTVRIRKPAVRLSGPFRSAGVEIHRRRTSLTPAGSPKDADPVRGRPGESRG